MQRNTNPDSIFNSGSSRSKPARRSHVYREIRAYAPWFGSAFYTTLMTRIPVSRVSVSASVPQWKNCRSLYFGMVSPVLYIPIVFLIENGKMNDLHHIDHSGIGVWNVWMFEWMSWIFPGFVYYERWSQNRKSQNMGFIWFSIVLFRYYY